MTKKIIWFSTLSILFIFTSNTTTMAQAKLDSRTKSYLKLSKKMERNLKKLKKAEKQIKMLTPLREDKIGGYSVGGLMKIDAATIDKKQLKKLGVKIGAKTKELWTFKAPFEQVRALSKVAGVNYIELDKKVRFKK